MSEAVWNVMTRTRGGTVSLLKNLTEDEARGVMQRLRTSPFGYGDPWSDHAACRSAVESIVGDLRSGSYDLPTGDHVTIRDGHQVVRTSAAAGAWATCNDGDLVQIECWGSLGATLDVWPKPPDYDERYAAIRERLCADAEAGKWTAKVEPWQDA